MAAAPGFLNTLIIRVISAGVKCLCLIKTVTWEKSSRQFFLSPVKTKSLNILHLSSDLAHDSGGGGVGVIS